MIYNNKTNKIDEISSFAIPTIRAEDRCVTNLIISVLMKTLWNKSEVSVTVYKLFSIILTSVKSHKNMHNSTIPV